jgi:hypothetical protein
MRLPSLAQNGPDTGRTRLGHFDENAFVFMQALESGASAIGR